MQVRTFVELSCGPYDPALDCTALVAVHAALHVDEANTPARRLYAAAGFVEGGRREDYYAVGRHAIFMERTLDS